jgi:DNA-binding NarL/FixJ family response regulator
METPQSPSVEPWRQAPEEPAHRVLIVDDHAALRACLRSLVEDHPDMAVVGEAATGEEAVALAELLSPDVVLMDVRLPRLSGIEATRHIRRLHPAPVVIGLTVHWTPELESDMGDAGAAECLAKADAADRLHRVILTARSAAPPDRR